MYNAIEIFHKVGGVRLAFGATRLRTLGSVCTNLDKLAVKHLYESPKGATFGDRLPQQRVGESFQPPT